MIKAGQRCRHFEVPSLFLSLFISFYLTSYRGEASNSENGHSLLLQVAVTAVFFVFFLSAQCSPAVWYQSSTAVYRRTTGLTNLRVEKKMWH